MVQMSSRLLLLAAVLAPTVASADPVKVAVVPGVAVNLDAARVDALTQDLAEALQAELVVDAVGGLEIRRQLPADGLRPDCVSTPACTADVAKRTGAQQLIFVVMVDSGGAIQVDATWLDASTGKSVSRPAIDLTSASDVEAKSKFASAAHTLLPDAATRPKPKTGISLNAHVTGATSRHMTLPAMVTAGVAVVGLGVGIGFGLKTRSLYNDCDQDPSCGTHDSRRDTIRRDALIADAGYVVAAGGVIATVIFYATSASTPVEIAPRPEGGATALWTGRF